MLQLSYTYDALYINYQCIILTNRKGDHYYYRSVNKKAIHFDEHMFFEHEYGFLISLLHILIDQHKFYNRCSS